VLVVSHDPAVRVEEDVVHELSDGKLVSTPWRSTEAAASLSQT
jgi:hypothetical protein